ncbi:hypothetical protein FH972_001343 [Carpinus fangiana]|uniref:Uncharacterized protein n=1 Tax=Carpinus fangiana TaxID=176857 RepID=A0A5N6QBM0_9ROSI|nr:hypothetical protein FH972_001343 [Carpinus fangiana]
MLPKVIVGGPEVEGANGGGRLVIGYQKTPEGWRWLGRWARSKEDEGHWARTI